MTALRERAPGVRIETMPLPRKEIADALDSGRIDFAFGFLPSVKETQRVQLIKDRYVVLLRKGHPFTRRRRGARALDGARCANWSSSRCAPTPTPCASCS